MSESKSVVSIDAMMSANQALDFCKSVEVIDIKTNEQAEVSARIFRELNGHIKTLKAKHDAEKEPHLKAGRDVDSFFKDAAAPLLNLKTKLDGAMTRYRNMLEDKRKEEQRKLDEAAAEARGKAEEQARIQREKEDAARRAEDEARQRAQAATNEAERRKAMAEAEKARAEAEKAAERAEVKEMKADTTVAAIAQVAAPDMKGIGSRSVLKCEIANPMLAIQWFIEQKMYSVLQINESTANAWAKSQGVEMTFPGGRIYKQVTTTGRGL